MDAFLLESAVTMSRPCLMSRERQSGSSLKTSWGSVLMFFFSLWSFEVAVLGLRWTVAMSKAFNNDLISF